MNQASIVLPASTSNLGASFDACGLALSLYLRVDVESGARAFEVNPTGEGSDRVPRDESNLIWRVARFIASDRTRALSPARLVVRNEIPLARGLGSSSAAIIAGISVYESLTGDILSTDEILRYALRFEDHGDNLAPSLLGGLVVVCEIEGPRGRTLTTIKRDWPEAVKLVLAIPDFEMNTREMRDALPSHISLDDAVFNVQRAALLQASMAESRFELLREALRDRLHQPYRIPNRPGLGDVLRMNDEIEKYPGLLGVAMSGAGSTMIAFATENLGAIGDQMAARFLANGVRALVVQTKVDKHGRTISRP
jgi:homoserine kinase